MKTKYMKCSNCGHDWGGHMGSHCWQDEYSLGPRDVFEPYPLDTICDICGYRLDEHRSHLFCPIIDSKTGVGSNLEFIPFTVNKITLESELFEI